MSALGSARRYQKQVSHCAAVLAFYAGLFCLFFAPVPLGGRLLAPGDGTVFGLPAFHAPWTLWSPDVFSGYPVAADPEIQSFYPLAWLFSLFGSWNAFVIAGYVMAACFTYGYVFTVTQSVLASLVGGTIYGMSGFFMAHLGHPNMIQAAAWMPLLLWALEAMRRQDGEGWTLVASLAVAQCTLAGHPQMLLYALMVAAAYVVVTGSAVPAGRWRSYYWRSAVAVTAGFGLAAVQLLPAVELTQLSQRAQLSFSEAVSYALPPHESIQLLFPYLFGYGTRGLYSLPYFGRWGLAETAGYIGVLPLIAAVVAVAGGRKQILVKFWMAIALLSAVLALGGATPLGWVVYRLPPYNRFRCPARQFVEAAFAVAALAGIGIAALQTGGNSGRRRALHAVRIVVALMTGGALLIVMLRNQLRDAAAHHGIANLAVWPWENPAVGVPLLVTLLSAGTILWFAGRPTSRLRSALLLVVLVADLGSFGWFLEWRLFAPERDVLEMPAALQTYKERVRASGSRVVSHDGPLAPREAAVPNLNRLWGIPNASGYTPLALQRYTSALPWADSVALRSENMVLDLLAARYLLLGPPPRAVRQGGFDWSMRPGSILFNAESRVEKWMIADVWATHVGFVGALGNAVSLTDGTQVGLLTVGMADGQVLTLPIRAGDELSEWAYDLADVQPIVAHRRASVFTAPGIPSQRYLAAFDLHGRHQVQRLEVEWMGPANVGILIDQASLRDESDRRSYPLNGVPADPVRWRHVEDLGSVAVYENTRALPRAWVVPRVVRLRPPEILAAIQHAQMPDGAELDPQRVALVEEPLELVSSQNDARGDAAVVALTDTQVELKTHSTAEAFLVLSDVNYPGWRAAVDGTAVRIYQTDYLLRGVVIPAGEHVVTFRFRPFTFYIGLGITVLSICYLVAARLRSHASAT